MKHKFYLLLLLISPILSAQIKGNAATISRQNIKHAKSLGNANVYGAQIQEFRHQSLVPNPVITVDVKVLSNIVADSYTAVFNMTQIGETSEETNSLMTERVNKVKEALLAHGLLKKDIVIDVISFVPVYETVVERKLFSKKYNEIPTGFELQQNLHIKFTKVSQFENILAACANNEIYNLVKVDYFIDNIEAVYTKLRAEILKVLKEKQQFYKDLGFDLSKYDPTVADTKYCHFPKEFYKNYQAFNSISMEAIKKKRGLISAKKQTSYYYEPLSFRDYDKVINPSIVEPVLQIGMELKLQYVPKPAEEKEPIQKETLVKNRYFMVSDAGSITIKELQLEN